ncbi:MAG TPA: hypothetical protein VHX68_14420 [Planctomycetaceae bacterium]|jgi:uncharacterized DUF497 family protein|nr:hypothetical protein [Planctomycetaceae bacterium]
MNFLSIVWDDSDGGNRQHIADHGLTPDDVEDLLRDPRSTFDWSRQSGLRVAFGYTSGGRYILVAFDEIDEATIYPVKACYTVQR